MPRLREGLAALWSWTLPAHGPLAAAFVCTVAVSVRLVNWDQPLLENYIDRQVHTAMIAGNLARGGSPLRPEIDIGPFPAYYMLEFPGYPAIAAAASRLTGWELDATGRCISALALAAACLTIFGLVRRTDGRATALVAALVLALMPVAIRYGRAFQPDSLMIAMLVAGVWAAQHWSAGGSRGWLAAASVCISMALLLKVIAAYVLVPLAYLAWRRNGRSAWRSWELWLAALAIVAPSAAWYVHACQVATDAATVSTPFWQVHKWIAPERFLDPATYRQLAYYIALRGLTPIGAVLLVVGVMVRVRPLFTVGMDTFTSPSPRLRGEGWGEGPTAEQAIPHASRLPLSPADGGEGEPPLVFHVWLASLLAYLPILVRKVDHEHYYLALAPVSAVFIARALATLARAAIDERFYVTGRVAAGLAGAGLAVLNLAAVASTFRTPREWRHVESAAATVRQLTPPDALVAGHSSVLFYAGRRGFTFAYGPDEIEYLFGTWRVAAEQCSPQALLEFYRQQGATHFVELLGTNRERENREFLAHIRATCPVLWEEPGKFLLVALQ